MKLIFSLFRQFLFWMLFFAVQRALFLIFFSKQLAIQHISFWESLLSFLHALRLDWATVSYFLVIPFLIGFTQLFSGNRLYDSLNKIYTTLLLLVSLLISVGEIGLFGEWNSKLSYKALVYLKNPSEVLSSVPTSDLILFFGLVVVQLALFLFLYNRFFYFPVRQKAPLWQKTLLGIILSGLLFIGIRGGLSAIPITISSGYFSKHNILNLAAVNPVYNLAFSAIEYHSIDSKNHFNFMPDEKAEAIVREIQFVEKDTTVSILNISRPNIVIIFLESWSGDLIESLGGDPKITPRFRELEKEGMLFTQFFASGNRSQQALASVFGGLPALPITTLTDYPEKYPAVPSLVKRLNKEGYFSSFYFGGDLDYGNIKSYLVYNEFDKLVAQEDFPSSAQQGKLGFHDEVLFGKLLEDLGSQHQPFFTATLTLSSHSPYDQPGERPIDWIEVENDYVNSVWYTDKCLGNFFELAKKQTWYQNTLFIVLADHSHVSYHNYQWWSFDYRRIPLLLLGGALNQEFLGSQNERICTNIDLSSTILKQLKLNSQEFTWSKNLFNPYSPQFANFELNDGFGWMRPGGKLEYNVVVPLVLNTNVKGQAFEQLKTEGEAYYQVLLKEFLSY